MIPPSLHSRSFHTPSPLQNPRSINKNRYSPSVFAHNLRLSIALAPCAAFLLDIGGIPVIITLAITLTIAYIIDAISKTDAAKQAAFIAVWFSLLAAQMVFYISSSLVYTFGSVMLGVMAALLCAETTFLIGVWASLQFKWVQMEYPAIGMALERILFACTPIVASVMFTWATVSAIGMVKTQVGIDGIVLDGNERT